MNTRPRLAAMALTIALVASACGGNDSNDLDTAQAQIDELTAQIEELSEASQTDAPVETTAAAPTTTEAAPVETTTTAAPEAAPVETTAAPSSGESGAVVANGSRVSSDMGAEEIALLADSLTGPTDDLSGTMARIYSDWPQFTTFPDTAVVGAITQLRTILEIPDRGWTQQTEVTFLTSAAPEDVVATFQAEATAMFGSEDVSESAIDNDGDLILLAEVADYKIQVQTSTSGQTIVNLSTSTGLPIDDDARLAYSGINADILGDHPLFVGNQPISYSIWHQNGNADIEAGYEFANSTEDELEALVVEIAEVEGWGEPASEFTDRYSIPSNGAQVRFSTIETERNSTAKAFITFGF